MAISQINSNSLATGVPSSANMPAGSVLQVVTATTTTAVSTTSSSYVTTGLAVSITPKFSTSKILILSNGICRTNNSGRNMNLTVFRGGTNIAPVASRGFAQMENAYTSGNTDCSLAFMYLDSPATTSSTTYTVYMLAESGQTVVYAVDNSFGGITLMEIAA
jgi:hypothetical protein